MCKVCDEKFGLAALHPLHSHSGKLSTAQGKLPHSCCHHTDKGVCSTQAKDAVVYQVGGAVVYQVGGAVVYWVDGAVVYQVGGAVVY